MFPEIFLFMLLIELVGPGKGVFSIPDNHHCYCTLQDYVLFRCTSSPGFSSSCSS